MWWGLPTELATFFAFFLQFEPKSKTPQLHVEKQLEAANDKHQSGSFVCGSLVVVVVAFSHGDRQARRSTFFR